MSFRVFLDTCVLYSASLNDVLLRIAERDCFAPHWSEGVLTELCGALVENAGLSEESAGRRIGDMKRSFPSACVDDYEELVDSMTCHDKDRHVLAAAVKGRCEVLVTFNVSDFPRNSLEPYGIELVTPDTFLLDQLDLHPQRVLEALDGRVREASRPPLTHDGLTAALARSGVPDFAEAARVALAGRAS